MFSHSFRYVPLIEWIIQPLLLPVTDILQSETESSYLAYLSIADNLDALKLQSILHTFLQSFNYNNFISHLFLYFKSNQVQITKLIFSLFFLRSNWQDNFHMDSILSKEKSMKMIILRIDFT